MTSALTNQMDTRPIANPATQSTKSATSTAKNSRTLSNSKANNSKKKTSEMWDTDFDGAWEMGRDLIREFVMKQNNRNRSISENDAAVCTSFDNEVTVKAINEMASADVSPSQEAKSLVLKRCDDMDNDEENLMRVAVAATSALFDKIEMNVYALNLPDSETVSSSSRITDSSLLMSNNEKAVIRSEGYSTPDTLASWNEMEAATASAIPRRDHESMNYIEMSKGCNIDTGSDCVDSGCDENNYLAAFEAKFDRNVEALWNDTKQDDLNANKGDTQMNHSFWFDYHNSGVDKQPTKINSNERFKQFLQMNQATCYPSTNANDRNVFAVAAAAVAAQPNSLNSNSSSTIGGMSLTSSIWADNPSNTEDDVSFYTNARHWDLNQSKSLGQKINVCVMIKLRASILF